MCQQAWDDLSDAYVFTIVCDGLLFDWLPGMDLVSPEPIYSPRSTFTAAALPGDQLLHQEIVKGFKVGAL